jgi:hypothetical protein
MDLEGGCGCGAIRYRLTEAPMIVHACHCRDCQRETGSAFVLNMWIERKYVAADHEKPRSFRLTAGSGKPHDIFYCGNCGTRLWSKYHAASGDTLMVRVGTLDHPEAIVPDIHIYTRSKVPWLELPKDKPAFPGYYDMRKMWPPESLERWRANVAGR